MTSGDSAFANQAAAQEIVQAEKMAALLDNLANASIQKNDTIDKLVTMNQQQAKIIANLTEAIAKLKAGSYPWSNDRGVQTLPIGDPPTLPGTQQGTAGCWVFGLRLDTAAPLVLFLERDIARMLLMLTQRVVATLGKAGPNLPPDRARQRTRMNQK
jgi:hypothetical protein